MPSRTRRVRDALQSALSEATDVHEAMAVADAVLRPALGAQASAWGSTDPATTLSTSCARFGMIHTGPGDDRADARERRLFQLEWADDDPLTFWDLARRRVTAAALRTAVARPGDVRRFTELLEPAGLHDELRLRLVIDDAQWATAILYRSEERPFSLDDVAVAAAAAPVIARALRAVLLRAVCDNPDVAVPPGSLLLDANDQVIVSSAAAEELLDALPERQVMTALTSIASAARARGAASLTVTGPTGAVAFHASMAKGVDGAVAAVVERPRAVELAPVIMRAMGFTARERQVTQELLHGASRRQLARRLGVSEHTVGDHLQHLYRKAAVSGRAELAATLFGQHYLPPRSAGVPPSPYGYFVGLDREANTHLSQ